MAHLKNIKKILALPTVLVLSLAVIMAAPTVFTIISNFTNWNVFDTETWYGYGYGYGCYVYDEYCYDHEYAYGYGYDPDSIEQERDTRDGWWAGSWWPRSTDKDIDEDTVEQSLEKFLDEDKKDKGDVSKSPFDQEINDAYQYAYSLGITTMDDVMSAMPEQGTTRAQLAKMMVQFANNALGKSIVSSRVEMCSSYDDVDASLSDLVDFITAACSMKIMGLEVDETTPLTNFDPNSFVSRWEIATVLGRLIFGNAYKDMDPYYMGYMQALFNADIITVNDPTIMDIRANIWIMLQRAHMWLAGK